MEDKWSLRHELLKIRDVVKHNANSRLPRIREEDRDAVMHLLDSFLLTIEAVHSYVYMARAELNHHYDPDEVQPYEIDIFNGNYVEFNLLRIRYDLAAGRNPRVVPPMIEAAYAIFLELKNALRKYTQEEVESA